VSEQLTQEILLEDPNFLREIVERVLQEMLEAEMTEHIGAAPYERSATRTGHLPSLKEASPSSWPISDISPKGIPLALSSSPPSPLRCR
jgi:hypothetical protein